MFLGEPIHEMELGPDGRLWILADAPGLEDDIWVFDFDTETYTPLANSYFISPRDLEFDASGQLWILENAAGTDDDIWRYDAAGDFFETLPDSFRAPDAFASAPSLSWRLLSC